MLKAVMIYLLTILTEKIMQKIQKSRLFSVTIIESTLTRAKLARLENHRIRETR